MDSTTATETMLSKLRATAKTSLSCFRLCNLVEKHTIKAIVNGLGWVECAVPQHFLEISKYCTLNELSNDKKQIFMLTYFSGYFDKSRCSNVPS